MRVRMKLSVSGTRDGIDWPAAGEMADLPAAEAVDLLNAGIAVPVCEQAPETATVAAPEKATRRRPAKRS